MYILGLVLGIIILLVLSALYSGSENAYFSLNENDLNELEEEGHPNAHLVRHHMDSPKQLLATLLVAINFVNIALVIMCTVLSSAILPESFKNSIAGSVSEAAVITAILLMFGEVLPKMYATYKPKTLALTLAPAIRVSSWLFKPGTILLTYLSDFVEKRVKIKNNNLSVDDLNHALELTDEHEQGTMHDNDILRGIIHFGNTDAKQIMTPRLEVKALNANWNFTSVIEQVREFGYSRMPVYEQTIDNIKGILYSKDLLPHLDQPNDFSWQKLIRPNFAIPENKKIDDLLKEFQLKKTHIATIVDEFGGLSGIVTLEDVLEEVVGEINDEFDEEDVIYSQLDKNTFVFEGKLPLKQFYKITGLNAEIFEANKGESDTLAGLILEIEGKIPKKNQQIKFEGLVFTIESSDNRRIKRIKVSLPEKSTENDEL